MYTLYGAQTSGSISTEIALQRCNVPFTQVTACTWEDAPGNETLKRINPLMQVPTLVLPDGSILTESAAILIELGLRYPASNLFTEEGRAQQIRGLVYIAANCYSAIGIIDYPERWLADPDEHTCAQLEKGTRRRLYQNWERFADLFMQPSIWRPQDPGALEILAMVVTHWSGTRDHLQTTRPAFHASLLQIESHPAISEVMQRHWP